MKNLKISTSEIAKICNVSQGTVVGCDNIGDIDKYKISIDSVGYSMAEIARGAIDIINGKRKDSLIIEHYLAEH